MHSHGGVDGISMICDKDVAHHYATEHVGEFERARCFTCEAPMRDDITQEMRTDFTPVFADVTLFKAVPIKFPDVSTPSFGLREGYSYVGDVATLPVAYLCRRHSGSTSTRWPMQGRCAWSSWRARAVSDGPGCVATAAHCSGGGGARRSNRAPQGGYRAEGWPGAHADLGHCAALLSGSESARVCPIDLAPSGP